MGQEKKIKFSTGAWPFDTISLRSIYSGQALIRGLVEENPAKAGLEGNRSLGQV
jgi:hypothetical protein